MSLAFFTQVMVLEVIVYVGKTFIIVRRHFIYSNLLLNLWILYAPVKDHVSVVYWLIVDDENILVLLVYYYLRILL